MNYTGMNDLFRGLCSIRPNYLQRKYLETVIFNSQFDNCIYPNKGLAHCKNRSIPKSLTKVENRRISNILSFYKWLFAWIIQLTSSKNCGISSPISFACIIHLDWMKCLFLRLTWLDDIQQARIEWCLLGLQLIENVLREVLLQQGFRFRWAKLLPSGFQLLQDGCVNHFALPETFRGNSI